VHKRDNKTELDQVEIEKHIRLDKWKKNKYTSTNQKGWDKLFFFLIGSSYMSRKTL